MELFIRIVELVDTNLIFCLIPMILTLKVIELIFGSRFEIKKALNLIRWTIIVYTIVISTFNLIEMAMNPDFDSFIARANGPYAWAYWAMLIAASILPFTLLIKKLASNFWYLLLVSFGMKSGVHFERFVIITTTLQGDYQNGNAGLLKSSVYGIGLFFLQGIIITILTLGVLEIIKPKKLGTTQV